MTMRKPTQLKRLHGTLRPDRQSANEPLPPRASGYCPRELPKAAKKWWRKQAPVLKRLGLLTQLDVVGAADMAICASRIQQGEALIERTGLVIKGREDTWVKNPAITIVGMYRTALFAWMREFGMTPASRSKIDAPGPEAEAAESDFERYQRIGEVPWAVPVYDDDESPDR